MNVKNIVCIAAAIALSACQIEADWERYLGVKNANESRIEWMNAMEAGPNQQLLSATKTIRFGADRKVDIYLAALNTSGSVLWEKVLDLGGDETVADMVALSDGWIMAVNDIDDTSKLVRINTSGTIVWSEAIADGKLRDVQVANGLIYTTGVNTYVYDLSANLMTQLDPVGETSWRVQPLQGGQFLVTGHAATTRYDAQGNILWSASHISELTHQADLLVLNNTVNVVHEYINGDDAVVQQFDLNTGGNIWTRSISLPADGNYSIHGPASLIALGGDMIVMLSNPSNRKFVRLSTNNSQRWSKSFRDGIARDIEVFSATEFVASGGTTTQTINLSGEVIATAKMPSNSDVTTGEVVVINDYVFAGASVQKDGTFMPYVARYSE